MIDSIIQWSLSNRLIVLMISFFVVSWGGLEAARMNVDVFPDLAAPTVTVVTDSHGMSPAELERSVTMPIETSLNGASNVRRIRSVIAEGVAVTKVDFSWGVSLPNARQIVSSCRC